MSEVTVRENESLDSALRRFKRNCAKAGIMQEIRKESIMKNQVLNVKRNQKLLGKRIDINIENLR